MNDLYSMIDTNGQSNYTANNEIISVAISEYNDNDFYVNFLHAVLVKNKLTYDELKYSDAVLYETPIEKLNNPMISDAAAIQDILMGDNIVNKCFKMMMCDIVEVIAELYINMLIKQRYPEHMRYTRHKRFIKDIVNMVKDGFNKNKIIEYIEYKILRIKINVKFKSIKL